MRFTNFGLDIQARTLALVGGVVAAVVAGLVDVAGNREVFGADGRVVRDSHVLFPSV